jgi:novel protein kinase C epsilon type
VVIPKVFDPYIAVDVDEVPLARTQTKPKTLAPVWNEEMNSQVQNGQSIGFTVFHDSAIPPDEFVANCTVAFEDLAAKNKSDIWVCFVMLCFNIQNCSVAVSRGCI